MILRRKHGRVITMTEPDPDGTGSGSIASPVTTYAYNGSGGVAQIIDPEGRETTYQYDSIGRRTGVTDDNGKQTVYAYDNFNNVTSVTRPDPDGAGPLTAAVTSQVFDFMDRVISSTDAESGVTTFTFDDAGNMLTLNDSVGNDQLCL